MVDVGKSDITKPQGKDLRKRRVAFIDQARTLAILLMLFGHPMQHFLAEPWRSSEFWRDYQFVRGVTSALFLTVSGFSFVIASFKYWDDFLVRSERLLGRFRRVALIGFLGTVLHVWAPTLLESIDTFDPVRWERLVSFGILQNVAVCLLLLHGLVLIVRRPERFRRAASIALLVIVGLAPFTYNPQVDAVLPLGLSSALNMYHQSRFPIVPWGGFVLMGAVFGTWYRERRDRGDEWKVFLIASVLGVLLIVFEQIFRGGLGMEFFPYSSGKPMTPGNTFARGGCALLVISALYALGRVRVFAAKFSLEMSRETLTIYFSHLVIVYGLGAVPERTGFYPEQMHPAVILGWVAVLVGSMAAVAYGLGWMRKNRPELLVASRHWLIGSAAVSFVFWPSLSVFSIITSSLVVLLALVAVERFRARLVRA